MSGEDADLFSLEHVTLALASVFEHDIISAYLRPLLQGFLYRNKLAENNLKVRRRQSRHFQQNSWRLH